LIWGPPKLIHITEDQLLFSNLCLQLTTERIFYEDRQIKRGLLIGFVLCNEENEISSYFVNWLEESTGAKLTMQLAARDWEID
jgi:hypothetical protein